MAFAEDVEGCGVDLYNEVYRGDLKLDSIKRRDRSR
jgi:hypothetical protein